MGQLDKNEFAFTSFRDSYRTHNDIIRRRIRQLCGPVWCGLLKIGQPTAECAVFRDLAILCRPHLPGFRRILRDRKVFC